MSSGYHKSLPLKRISLASLSRGDQNTLYTNREAIKEKYLTHQLRFLFLVCCWLGVQWRLCVCVCHGTCYTIAGARKHPAHILQHGGRQECVERPSGGVFARLRSCAWRTQPSSALMQTVALVCMYAVESRFLFAKLGALLFQQTVHGE